LLGRCRKPERPFCTLARYTRRRRTLPFIYMCLSGRVSRRETRMHAGRCNAGRSLRPRGRWDRPYLLSAW
jgi:hypothetical protein